MQPQREADYRRHLTRYLTESDSPLHRRHCFIDAKALAKQRRRARDIAALDAVLLGYIARDGVTTIKKLHGQCVDDGLPIPDSETGYKAVLRRVHHLLDKKLTTRKEVVDPTRRK